MEYYVENRIRNLEMELDFAPASYKRKIKKELKQLKEILKDYQDYKKEVAYKLEH